MMNKDIEIPVKNTTETISAVLALLQNFWMKFPD